MMRSYLILLTQRCSRRLLGKPILLMRDTTERLSHRRNCSVGGYQASQIVDEVIQLMESDVDYQHMARANNPYGLGDAAEHIAAILSKVDLEQKYAV